MIILLLILCKEKKLLRNKGIKDTANISIKDAINEIGYQIRLGQICVNNVVMGQVFFPISSNSIDSFQTVCI